MQLLAISNQNDYFRQTVLDVGSSALRTDLGVGVTSPSYQ